LLRDDLATPYGKEPPSAVACLDDDFEAFIARLRFPLAHSSDPHHQSARAPFGEVRRRTIVIPHAFGERAVLKLVYAALIRAAERWRGIRITEFEQRQLTAIRGEIDKDFTARNAPPASVTVTKAPTHLSSNDRT
jgi:transposase-like protein